MKNTKLAKIVTLVLSAVLLIGCAVAISVSAAESAPSVEIAHKNIAYEGAIKVVYAVDAQNYDAETQSVIIRFTVGGETYDKPLTEDYKEFEDGSKYNIVYSKGIAPKNMRQTITATPLIINNDDGETVAEGESVEYSVYQYAMNRFSKEPTADQKELYVALLDYGAAVQRALADAGLYTAEELAACGGYADEYYAVKINSVVNGEIAKYDLVTMNEYDAKFGADVAKVLPNEIDGNYLQGFTDENGEYIYGLWYEANFVAEKLGETVVTANYGNTSDGVRIDYATGTLEENFIKVDANATEAETNFDHTCPTDGAVYAVKYTTNAKAEIVTEGDLAGTFKHSKHQRILRVLNAEGTEVEKCACEAYYKDRFLPNSYSASTCAGLEDIYVVGTDGKGTKSLSGQGTIAFKSQVEDLYGDAHGFVVRHVFETDLYIPASANAGVQGWFKDNTNNNAKIWGYSIAKSGNTFSLRVQGNTDKQDGTCCPDHGTTFASGLACDTWHNLRFEYYDLPDDQMAVYVFVNGKLCKPTQYESDFFKYQWWTANTYNPQDDHMVEFSLNYYSSCTDVDMYYDNTYMTTEYVEINVGNGKYANDSAVVDFDYTEELAAAGKTWDDIYSYKGNKTFLGFTNNGTFGSAITNYQYQHIVQENGDYYLANVMQGTSDGKEVVFGTNSNMPTITTSKALAETQTGSKYVFEFDLRYNGLTAANEVSSSDANNTAIINVYSDVTSNDNCRMLHINVYDPGVDYDYYTIGSTTGPKFPKNQWNNIRVEVTPKEGSTTLVTYEVYVNGASVLTGSYTAKVENTQLGGASFQVRSRNTHWSYDIDNIFVGAVD